MQRGLRHQRPCCCHGCRMRCPRHGCRGRCAVGRYASAHEYDVFVRAETDIHDTEIGRPGERGCLPIFVYVRSLMPQLRPRSLSAPAFRLAVRRLVSRRTWRRTYWVLPEDARVVGEALRRLDQPPQDHVVGRSVLRPHHEIVLGVPLGDADHRSLDCSSVTVNPFSATRSATSSSVRSVPE